MNCTGTARLLAVALAVGGLLAGCVERKERIVVETDGTVRIRVEHVTKSFDELYEGDAVPSVEGGWLVTESVERDEDGEETFRLVAEAAFAPDARLPSSYAGPRDPDPDLSIVFPTAVTFERRRDGWYVHFSRRYVARPWAYLERARKMVEEAMEAAGDRDLRAMTPGERAATLRLLARFETVKQRVFAREAFRIAMPEAPQDVWLMIRATLAETAEAVDYAHLAELFGDEETPPDEEELALEEERFHDAALKAMERVLTEARVGRGPINAFLHEFRRRERFYEITRELEDDAFEITVTLPGEIVGHNADDRNGDELVWKLTGEHFRDRDYELLATSRFVE